MRTWFITGASSGFGRLAAETLLERGDRVVATVRKRDALDTLADSHHARLHVVVLDVTDTPAVHRVVADAFRALGRIDVVVSNAGYALSGAAEELSDDQIRDQIHANLIGSIQVIRAVLPHLRAQGGGRVIQVSSVAGQAAFPNFSLYCASKWGIEGFVDAVSREVASFGIEFTIVEPGSAPTRFRDNHVSPPELDIYADTAVGALRRAIADGSFKYQTDPVKAVRAMIDSVEVSPAPARLAMGAGALDAIHAALTERLACLDAHRGVAIATSADD